MFAISVLSAIFAMWGLLAAFLAAACHHPAIACLFLVGAVSLVWVSLSCYLVDRSR